jgi:hypothetical protein
MVTHDHLRIALPSGPGGQDNFVLGLAVDRSVDTVSGIMLSRSGVAISLQMHSPHTECRGLAPNSLMLLLLLACRAPSPVRLALTWAP